MIRSKLVRLLANEHPDLALRDIEAIVTTFFDQISSALLMAVESNCVVSVRFLPASVMPAPDVIRAPAKWSMLSQSGFLISNRARSCTCA